MNVPPVAAGADVAAVGADELLDTGDAPVVLAGADELPVAAVALGDVELAVLACFLLDEHAELRSARARLAAAILAHRCLAFMSLS